MLFIGRFIIRYRPHPVLKGFVIGATAAASGANAGAVVILGQGSIFDLPTAAIGMVSLVLLFWQYKEFSPREAMLISVVVGVSVLLWRMAGNVAQLNDDPVPPLSPNDVLCPVVTYVLLGSYGAFHNGRVPRWEQVRALLALVSFAVNVITI